jgi:hypothetical protein
MRRRHVGLSVGIAAIVASGCGGRTNLDEMVELPEAPESGAQVDPRSVDAGSQEDAALDSSVRADADVRVDADARVDVVDARLDGRDAADAPADRRDAGNGNGNGNNGNGNGGVGNGNCKGNAKH